MEARAEYEPMPRLEPIAREAGRHLVQFSPFETQGENLVTSGFQPVPVDCLPAIHLLILVHSSPLGFLAKRHSCWLEALPAPGAGPAPLICLPFTHGVWLWDIVVWRKEHRFQAPGQFCSVALKS